MKKNNTNKYDVESQSEMKGANDGQNPKNSRVNRRTSRGGARSGKTSGCRYSHDNDPAWYGKSPALLRDAASLAFSNVTGNPIRWSNLFTSTLEQSMPGILALNWFPSYFSTNEATASMQNEALNVSGKNIYSYVRHANSGSANYDWQDLMLTIIAADNVFSLLAMGIRAYGVAMQWEQKNRYTPEHLLSAMGFDANSVLKDLAGFRYRLNLLIQKSSVIWVPTNMPIVARHFWLNSNVYMDNLSAKAQFYLYRMIGYYTFENTTSTSGGKLKFNKMLPEMTADDYFRLVNAAMEILITDEDAGIMFGDMLKAYGKENLYSVSTIDENFRVVPSYSQEVLLQIHNAVAAPVSMKESELSSYDITQNIDTGTLNPPHWKTREGATQAARNALMAVGQTSMLNFKGSETPDPSMVMVATRSRNTILSVAAPENGVSAMEMLTGSEIITEFSIRKLEEGGLNKRDINTVVFNNNTAGLYIQAVAELSKFDWAPIVYVVKISDSPLTNTLEGVYGDIDNYTILTPHEIDKMNQTAIMSELDVPITL
nr:MAG: putative capsid protein [Hubei picobirnavirus 52]